tara:strand:+ start:6526 stop:6666 length:141 start_codon:yes stop_codon:yes gene_type:complete
MQKIIGGIFLVASIAIGAGMLALPLAVMSSTFYHSTSVNITGQPLT